MNIKTVLTARFLLIVALILGAFSILVYQFSAGFRQRDYYERLGNKLDIHVQRAHQMATGERPLINSVDTSNKFGLYKEEVMVYNQERQLIYRTPYLYELRDFPKDFDALLQEGGELETVNNKKEVLAKRYEIEGQIYYAWCSALDQYGYSKIDFLQRTLIILFLVGLFLTAVTGWHFSREALKPISEVVQEVEKISASNLDSRVSEGNGKDEVAQLSITFNAMLQRLQDAFELQKGFVSNASHEFRTPLTAMKGQIEVMLFQDRSTEEYKETLRSLNEEIDKLIELLKGLSQLASTSSIVKQGNLPICHLPQLALEAAEELKQKHPEYHIRLGSFDIPESDLWVSVKGNEVLLKSAILNLLDNACKYAPDKTARITLGYRSQEAFISISDHGEGIPPQELLHIFEPFYRSTHTRSKPGHGIGLSLVKRIMEEHHGRIEVQENKPKGSIFTLWIPHLSAN